MLIGLSATCAAAMSGCETALFPDNAPRTAFYRYQVLRNQERQQSVSNAYGGNEPNLRERLQPLGQP